MNAPAIAGLLPAVFLSGVFYNAKASVEHMSLKQAMLSNKIIVSAHSTGGYMGKRLKIDLLNITCDPISVNVDPALIFVPGDTNYQNLVVVGDESINLQPDKSESIVLQTFCGKSFAWSPKAGIHFNFWKQGDSVMIKTMHYIKQFSLYNHLGQSAIWTLTNGKCISTIYDPENAEASKDFVSFESSIRKLPIPDYFTYYQIDTSCNAVTCVSDKGKQYIDLAYKDGIARNIYVIVLDNRGRVYNKNDIRENIKEGIHTVTVNFDDAVDKAGIYAILLRDDNNNILARKLIRVGQDWCY